jgi:hypothetical protein
MKTKYIKLIILVCLSLGSYCYAQEHKLIVDINTIREFIPEWSKGETWEIKTYSTAGERLPPWISGELVKMTVLETPSKDTNDCYVLSYVNTVFDMPSMDTNGVLRYDGDEVKRCVFIFLRAKDLSLKEYRENGMIGGLTGEELETKLTDWKNTKSCGLSVGPIRHNWIYSAFPRRQNGNIEIGKVDGKPAMIDDVNLYPYSYYDAIFVWQKGDPWWTTVKFYDTPEKVRYRMELVKPNKELEGKNTAEKFDLLYSRWKQAGDANNTIEEREYYYRIVNLGRDALPYVVEKLKAGDEETIKLISELNSNIRGKATKAECLEWWDRMKKYEESRKQVP